MKTQVRTLLPSLVVAIALIGAGVGQAATYFDVDFESDTVGQPVMTAPSVAGTTNNHPTQVLLGNGAAGTVNAEDQALYNYIGDNKYALIRDETRDSGAGEVRMYFEFADGDKASMTKLVAEFDFGWTDYQPVDGDGNELWWNGSPMFFHFQADDIVGSTSYMGGLVMYSPQNPFDDPNNGLLKVFVNDGSSDYSTIVTNVQMKTGDDQHVRAELDIANQTASYWIDGVQLIDQSGLTEFPVGDMSGTTMASAFFRTHWWTIGAAGVDNVVITPEPASLALMGLAGLAVVRRRKA